MPATAEALTEAPGLIFFFFTPKSPVNQRVFAVLCNLSAAESCEAQPAPARHKRGLLWKRATTGDRKREKVLTFTERSPAFVNPVNKVNFTGCLLLWRRKLLLKGWSPLCWAAHSLAGSALSDSIYRQEEENHSHSDLPTLLPCAPLRGLHSLSLSLSDSHQFGYHSLSDWNLPSQRELVWPQTSLNKV